MNKWGETLRAKGAEKWLIIQCVLFGSMIILSSIQAIFSPYIFIRSISIITIIVLSTSVGAFIREWFVLNKKEK